MTYNEKIKALQKIIGAIIGILCPIALAVTGYFVIFMNFNWFYLIIILGIYIAGLIILLFAVPKKSIFVVYYQIMSGGFGWVWILSIISSIWFVISALFFAGSWWEFAYSFVLGSVCKGWTRTFNQAKIDEISNT